MTYQNFFWLAAGIVAVSFGGFGIGFLVFLFVRLVRDWQRFDQDRDEMKKRIEERLRSGARFTSHRLQSRCPSK